MRSFQNASSARVPSTLVSPRRVTLRASFDGTLHTKTVGASPLHHPDRSDNVDQATRSSSSCSCPCSPSPSLGRSQLSLTPSTCASSSGQSMIAKTREEFSVEYESIRKMKEEFSLEFKSLRIQLKEECESMCTRMKDEMSALSQRVDEISRYVVCLEQSTGVLGPLLDKSRKELEEKMLAINDISDCGELQGLVDAAVRLGLNPKSYAPVRERQVWLESGSKKDSLRQQLDEMRNAMNHPRAAEQLEAGDPEALQQLIDDSVRVGIGAKEIQCARQKLRDLEDLARASAIGSSMTDVDVAQLGDASRDAQQWETFEPALDLDQPQEISFTDQEALESLAEQDAASSSYAASSEAWSEVRVLRDLTNCSPRRSSSGNGSRGSSPGLGAKRIDSTHSPVGDVVFKEAFTFSENVQSGMVDDVNLRARSGASSPFAREFHESYSSASRSPARRHVPQEADNDIILDLSNVLDEVHTSVLGNSLDESLIAAGIDESFDGAPPSIARPLPSPSTMFFLAPLVGNESVH